MRFLHIRMHLQPCLTDRLTDLTASCMQSVMQLHDGGVALARVTYNTVIGAAVDLPRSLKRIKTKNENHLLSRTINEPSLSMSPETLPLL